MSREYVVKGETGSHNAKVFASQKELATLERKDRGKFSLSSRNGEWTLTNRVDGEVRPFSMIALPDPDSGNASSFKIRDNLFSHNGNFYLVCKNPEGRPYKDFVVGARFICRLVKFPFSDLEHVDYEARSMLKRLRGTPVGEMYGIGSSGFHLKIDSELEDVGLPLAASSYLIYSTP